MMTGRILALPALLLLGVASHAGGDEDGRRNLAAASREFKAVDQAQGRSGGRNGKSGHEAVLAATLEDHAVKIPSIASG